MIYACQFGQVVMHEVHAHESYCFGDLTFLRHHRSLQFLPGPWHQTSNPLLLNQFNLYYLISFWYIHASFVAFIVIFSVFYLIYELCNWISYISLIDQFLMFAGSKCFSPIIGRQVCCSVSCCLSSWCFLYQSLNAECCNLIFSRWYSFLGSEFCPTGFSPNKVLTRPPFLGLRRSEEIFPLLPLKGYKYTSLCKLQAAHSRFCFLAFTLDCGLSLLAPVLIPCICIPSMD